MQPNVVYAIMAIICITELVAALFFHKRKQALEALLASPEVQSQGPTPEREALIKRIATLKIIIIYMLFVAFGLPALLYVALLGPLAQTH